ncbi:unnamed protein product [Vicia faba]|uniref:Uncharacterized protein n=1 Tax=Vicia faba TaxID=3906 RepID=A0AAV0ZML8_VICFA|nr:unnamed protein product [Vicia faba]
MDTYRYVDVEEDAICTQFQGLEVANSLRVDDVKPKMASANSADMVSFRDAQRAVTDKIGQKWGSIVELPTNTDCQGLDYSYSGAQSKRKISEHKIAF